MSRRPAPQRPPSVHQRSRSRQPVEDREVTVLLIGRTGNGKSSTGNSLLGRAVFAQSTGILSATEHTQLGEARRSHGNRTFKLQVVDLPDITSDMTDERAASEVQDAMTLTFPCPSAICVVVRADVRFTPEEHATYRRTMELVQGHVQKATDRLVVVFTMADRLPAQLKDGFKDQLRKANSELQQLLQDACGRYVLLGNQDVVLSNHDSPVSGRERSPNQGGTDTDTEGQLSQLLDIVFRLHRSSSSEPPPASPIHVMLLGAAGSGKSATGNTLAHPHHPFSVQRGMSFVGRGDQQKSVTVCGFQLQILDTSNGPDDDHQDDQWRARLHTGQHVLLLVLSANQRFDQHHVNHLTTLRTLLGGDVTKHVIVVLTGGDTLTEAGRSVEEEVRRAPAGLRTLLQQVGGRYVVLDNSSTCHTQRLLYRNALLEAIVQLLHSNKGRMLRLRERGRRAQAVAGGVSSDGQDTANQTPSSPSKLSWPSMPKCSIS